VDPLLLPLPDRAGEDGGSTVARGSAAESGTDGLHVAAVEVAVTEEEDVSESGLGLSLPP